MAELDYTNDHMEQLYEIAGQEGVEPCPVCGEERVYPRKPYGCLSMAGTIAVSMVCGNGCDMWESITVKVNDAGDLEPYEPLR